MMISPEILEMLVCPATKQKVFLAEESLIRTINQKIEEENLQNFGKQPVQSLMEGGIIREDQKVFYPIRNGIPMMSVEEAISIENLEQ